MICIKRKLFSVPFNNDFSSYKSIIIKNFKDYIKEVYFSLPSSLTSNARNLNEGFNVEDIISFIKENSKSDVESVLVLNSGWYPLETYSKDYFDNLKLVLDKLTNAGLAKVIIKNNYIMASSFLQYNYPSLKIEASVNQILDTKEKIFQALEMFGYDGVVVDRSFNRRWKDFVELSEDLRKNQYYVKIMVNESCLYNCPFKHEHDCIIGMTGYMGADFKTYSNEFFRNNTHYNRNNLDVNINKNYGCNNYLTKEPWQFLKSPFIRPEDMEQYLPYVDIVKIAGRSMSTKRIERMIVAYIDGTYEGDLKDIMEGTWIPGVGINNKLLQGFFETTKDCSKNCSKCKKCRQLYENANYSKSLFLKGQINYD